MRNGELLEKAQTYFDVFLTGDRNLTFQQQLSEFDIAIVVLQAETIQLQQNFSVDSQGSDSAANG